MNPLRRVLEAVGLKPKSRRKRLPVLTSSLDRLHPFTYRWLRSGEDSEPS